jgi:hypothetical protein
VRSLASATAVIRPTRPSPRRAPSPKPARRRVADPLSCVSSKSYWCAAAPFRQSTALSGGDLGRR